MGFLDRLKQRYRPEKYWQDEFEAFEQNFQREKSAEEDWADYQDRQSIHDQEALEFIEIIRSYQDPKLVAQAMRMGILLEDFSVPDHEGRHDSGYYVWGQFGEKILHSEIHKKLRKAVREKMADYKKEKRDFWQFWISNFFGAVGLVTGLIAVIKS